MDSYEALHCDKCGALVGFGASLDPCEDPEDPEDPCEYEKLRVSVLCSACMVVSRKRVGGAEQMLLPLKSSTEDTLVETRSLVEAG